MISIKFSLYAKDLSEIYQDIDDYNPARKKKLIAFNDRIADIVSNEIFQAIVKELFIRVRKHKISLVFITQFCFSVPRDIRLNSTHY